MESILKQKYSEAEVKDLMNLVLEKQTFEQGDYSSYSPARIVKNDLVLVSRLADSYKVVLFFADLDEAKSSVIFETLKNFGSFPKPMEYGLKLQLISQHFEYYSADSDIKVLDSLSKEVESSYSRITGDFGTDFKEHIKVYVYPDVATFHKAIGHPELPDWVAGVGGNRELSMVSPLNPGSAHTSQDLMKTVVHEFTHVTTMNVNGNYQSVYKWLSEGLATYESEQYTAGQIGYIKQGVLNNSIPTLSAMETSDGVGFGDMGGYPYSFTIIEFMVNKYGMDKTIELVRKPTDFTGVLGVSKDEFEKMWIQYLKDNYK